MLKNYIVVVSNNLDVSDYFMDDTLKKAQSYKEFDYFDDAKSYFDELLDTWDFHSRMDIILYDGSNSLIWRVLGDDEYSLE